MQPESNALPLILSEIVRLAEKSGSHEARISRLETDVKEVQSLMRAVPSSTATVPLTSTGTTPMASPTTAPSDTASDKMGTLRRILGHLRLVLELYHAFTRLYQKAPWGVLAMGIGYLWYKYLAPWLGF